MMNVGSNWAIYQFLILQLNPQSVQYQSNKMQHNYTTKICSYGQCSTVWRNYSTVQKRSEVPEVPAGIVTCSHTSVQQPVTV